MDSESTDSPEQQSTLNLEDMINDLQAQRIACEAQEKYIEAREIALRIAALKEEAQKRKVYSIKYKQRSDREIHDQGCYDEIAQFQDLWESKFKDFLAKSKSQEESLIERHKIGIIEERKNLEESTASIFKPSVQLLNLIKSKEKAVKLQNYEEAHSLLQHEQGLRTAEEARFYNTRQNKIDQLIQQTRRKFDIEEENLRKRLRTQFEEMKKTRDRELERIQKKHENNRRELERAQNVQQNIVQGRHRSGVGASSLEGSSILRIITSTKSGYSTPSLNFSFSSRKD